MIWLRKLTFYEKVVIIQFVSLLLAFAFQLLAVLTVPITNLTLSNYEGYRFGVFGLCDDSGCSIGQIGYSPYSVNRRLKGFAFPSNARHSMSYLLVVHPISTAFTGVQLILTALLFFNTRFSSSGYYVFLQLWSLPTFLLALLSFLTDLLMFIPHLTWCGWVLLASACCIALNGTLLCVLRRAAYSRIARQYTKNFSRNEIDLSAVDLVTPERNHHILENKSNSANSESLTDLFTDNSSAQIVGVSSMSDAEAVWTNSSTHDNLLERPPITANQQLGDLQSASSRSRLENPAREILKRD